MDEFSSQEDSVVDETIRVASLIRPLPSEAAQMDCYIILNQQGENDVPMIHLEAAESAPASQSTSPEPLIVSSEKSRSQKRK